MVSQYKRPDDNCCYFYYGEGKTEKSEEPHCWDLKTGKALLNKVQKYTDDDGFDSEDIKGVDCGRNTWVDLFN